MLKIRTSKANVGVNHQVQDIHLCILMTWADLCYVQFCRLVTGKCPQVSNNNNIQFLETHNTIKNSLYACEKSKY